MAQMVLKVTAATGILDFGCRNESIFVRANVIRATSAIDFRMTLGGSQLPTIGAKDNPRKLMTGRPGYRVGSRQFEPKRLEKLALPQYII